MHRTFSSFDITDYLLRFIARQDISIATHSLQVKNIAVEFAMTLGFSPELIRHLSTAALLHDIGKLIIPRNILHKPGKLTHSEFEIIKQHSQNGFNFLKTINQFHPIAEAVLCHHEKFNGGGYPEGKGSQDIPLLSRILTIADVYEATTADRVYRRAMTQKDALQILADGKGSQFDPILVAAFLKYINDCE